MKLIRDYFDKNNLLCEESLFHTANGYLGVRGNFEEGYPSDMLSIRGCYINGFYDTVELKYPEALHGFPNSAQRMINLPDVQTIRLLVGEEEFSLFEGELLSYQRCLDMSRGVSVRSIEWRSPKGAELNIKITRMASFAVRELFCIDYRITSVNYDGEVRFTSTVDGDVRNFSDPSDPRVASESVWNITPASVQADEDIGVMKCRTAASGLTMAVCTAHELTRPAQIQSRAEGKKITTTIQTRLQGGESVALHKYCVLCDSRRQEYPVQAALNILAQVRAQGLDALYLRQEQYLNQFWKQSRVEIDGDAIVQQALDFNLYGLLQSAGCDSVSNIAAKGLSGEGYEGHYFWDTEIYMFPFFLMTQPEMAKRLLDFRYGILDSARVHARIMGHRRGALYPWRTITGSECSSYFPSGSAQYHINGDVAHSFLQYYYATDDLGYMAEKGAEVLFEAARLWLDAGHYNSRGMFCIDAVTGPDEYTCIVNNNYFTNRSAQQNLCGAAEIYHALQAANSLQAAEKIGLSAEEAAEFERAAAAMYLPYDEQLDINPQDDSFMNKAVWDFANTPPEDYPLLLHYHPLALYRHQVCKQADTVLAHCLYDEGIAESTIRNSLHYYEKITTHDSSLSTCIFGIVSARLGEAAKAYQYFLNTACTDLENAHGNTKDGIHTANMGGSYLAIVAGFAGLRCRADGMHFSFALPDEWEGYRFRLRYRKSLLQVEVKRCGSAIKLLQGPPVRLFVEEREYLLEDSLSFREVSV
ncbi:glycosyl hydrolase family 65 protein [Hydrogenoanaerobacterium sp.]|uniref:glycoside hydrolase family 65 protein n=1 Tax=Hydrogenoanaerobacterium sp. TaxID=2953763 RepID=UPI00289EBF43|nr:glycosyl hydrolase family 65 protein [Hydrogenoanaerobacterium sp.]